MTLNGIEAVTDGYRGITGANQIRAEYQAETLRIQKDVMQEAGDQAVHLIQSSVITDPQIGQYLDVFA